MVLRSMRTGAVLAGMLAAVLAALWLATGCGRGGGGGKGPPLVCHVGGTMRPIMEELAGRYGKETGREVHIEAAGSGELLIRIETTSKGDLYVCHDPFAGALMQKGLGVRVWTVASLTPVIAVAKGNPKKIAGLADLAKPGLRVGLTDSQYSTTGHIVRMALDRLGRREEIMKNVRTRTRQGGAAANAVALGSLDATIVWNAVVHLRRDKLDAVPIEKKWAPAAGVDVVTTATYGPIDMGCVAVTIATLKCSKQPEAATEFAEYIASRAAAGVFDEHGFSPPPQAGASLAEVEGAIAAGSKIRAIKLYRELSGKGLKEAKDFVDGLEARMRAERPELYGALSGSIFVHCGASMRKPVARLAAEFSARTGVSVEANYSGSNILLGQIDLTRKGDVYIPGDADYVEMARKKGLVESSGRFCRFVPVIMVARGNPKGLKALADLAAPGLRVGLGDEKACAIGRLMPELFEKNGVDLAAVRRRVVLNTATANELGLKIKLGTIDATVVWRSVAAQYPDDSETVPFPEAKNTIVTVPAAVLTTAANPAAARRFVSFLGSSRAREVLEEFHFVADDGDD